MATVQKALAPSIYKNVSHIAPKHVFSGPRNNQLSRQETSVYMPTLRAHNTMLLNVSARVRVFIAPGHF